MTTIPSVPIITAKEALALEAGILGGDERKEWRAMQAAGQKVAEAALADVAEAGGFPEGGSVLVLAGKGNNAGDALIAAREILATVPNSTVDVLFAFGPRGLKPLAAKAWRGLSELGKSRVRSVGTHGLSLAYDLCLDGIFGLQYRAPLAKEALEAIEAATVCDVRLRAAVDLPSGLDEPGAFQADFTYATGSVKAPLPACLHAGRPRFLDIGFFHESDGSGYEGSERVLLPSLLSPLARLRPAHADKRSQGHLAIVGGSMAYPGAVLMAVLSALRSGAGLVTAWVPEALVPSFAARAPEAMWVGLPTTPTGGLGRGGLDRIIAGLERASALVVGPGLGRDPETLSLALEIVMASQVPLLIDADALQPDIVRAGKAPRILTPHEGEFARISKGADLRALASEVRGVVVRKGPVTRMSDGAAIYHVFKGGPVLSRGGSGDILAGLTGGLLAQTPEDLLAAACRGPLWHATAADLLARSQGQTSVHTLQLLDFLAPALRESAACQAS